MEDAHIIGLYWARDEGAIPASDEKYGGLCRALAQNILGSSEDAEECVNDTWHRAWDTMPPQRPDSLRAYLGRIVRNFSISRYRALHARKRYAGAEVLLSELGECVSAPESVSHRAEAGELTELIERWLGTLGGEDRALFLRRYWYGDAVGELAGELGVRPNALTKRLTRLREGLRRYLESEGVAV